MAKILLVDDGESLRTAMRLALIFDDHEVLPATTASEAIRIFAEHAPDLLLCDVYLPGNGLTVLEHVRERVDPVRLRGAYLATKLIDPDRFREIVSDAVSLRAR